MMILKMTENLIPLEHPGIVIKEEFVEPLGVSVSQLCRDTGISRQVISAVLRGERRVTPRIGIRLSRYFGLSEGYFSRLQLQYDKELDAF